jgi:hypothetical protein
MAGDLEDFLKRAAERRAQKQQQGGRGAAPDGRPQQTARPRPRPEYTDSRRERQIREPAEDAIPVAELVEEVNPLAEQQRKVAEAKKRAEEARKRIAELQSKSGSSQGGPTSGSESPPEGTPIEQLLEMIRRPNGIQQAFLLKEILDRPMDRW